MSRAAPPPAAVSSPVDRRSSTARSRPVTHVWPTVLAGLSALVLLAMIVGSDGPGGGRLATRGLSAIEPSPIAAPVPTAAPAMLLAPTGLAGAEPTSSRCVRPWTAPVDAPVVDPFRPPSTPYGPGNRGLEYGTEPGQLVVAVADGVVRFAGPVGGSPVVVIEHGGGLVSTSVQLLDRSVVRGQLVARGEPVAVAAAGFHLTARLGGRYVDPAGLLERRCVVVRLVVPPEPESRR